MRTILLIEDDPAIRTGLTDAFESDHYRVLTADNGAEGERMARANNVDMILLDLMLPQKNGDDLCRDLRKDGIDTPIIMLTCKAEEMDRVVGLEIGADDYLTKPFSIRELQARVRAVLRRGQPRVAEFDEYSFGPICLDFRAQVAMRDNERFKLSAMEWKIIKFFVEHEGLVITRDMLLDHVWGYDSFPTTRTVDNFMLSLRKKIERNPSEPQYLVTVHGSGYRFIGSKD